LHFQFVPVQQCRPNQRVCIRLVNENSPVTAVPENRCHIHVKEALAAVGKYASAEPFPPQAQLRDHRGM
jgi:hypothetical protein